MNLSRISKKQPHEDSRMTLTAIHEKKMKDFETYYETLPEKKELLEKLSSKYRSQRNEYSNETHSLKKQIKELEKEITEIEEKTDESEYLLKASSFLQNYKNSQNNSKNNLIESNKKSKNKKENKLSSFIDIDIEKKSNKGQLSRKYIQECLSDGVSLGTDLTNVKNYENSCQDCDVERVVNHKEAIAVCPECGDTVEYQDNDVCAEFSEEIEVLSPFSYKRINHFKEWISMLLARESSSPPDEVIDVLLVELKKNRITNKEDVTPERIRQMLRSKGLNKCYEHIPSIIHRIAGTSPPKISRELENKLISMFEEIQIPFERHRPPTRKNFLSYSYVLYKLCQILGEDELLNSFPLLKSREKLYEQDVIFKKICNELGWKFTPSL